MLLSVQCLVAYTIFYRSKGEEPSMSKIHEVKRRTSLQNVRIVKVAGHGSERNGPKETTWVNNFLFAHESVRRITAYDSKDEKAGNNRPEPGISVNILTRNMDVHTPQTSYQIHGHQHGT